MSMMIPKGEQVADSGHSAAQQFSSMFSTEEQAEQLGRMSRLGVVETSAQAQEDGGHRLQDEP
jgi:hypothetical protein